MDVSKNLRIFALMKRLIGIIVVGAMVLLMGCSGDKAQRLQQLEQLEQQNRSGEPMLNDSLAEDLVSYFDRHGDANERMRSRYILGRTYYCLGELPRALELYNEAADCADTTSADCDFAKLSRVYAQRAAIFHSQVQPRSQLEDLRKAEYYAWKDKDTLQAIECYAQQADAYEYLHISDSVISVTEECKRMFIDIGRLDRANQILARVILPYVKMKDFQRAKICIDAYDSHSGFFDDKGNISEGREIYYHIKGEYYLAIHKLDSAENLFRMELRDGKDLNNQIAGCKGLQMVYERRGLSDSIAKYAKLGYELNDSAYSDSEMQNIQKLQASYNYNHQKQLAEQSKRDAERLRIIFVSIVIVILVVAGSAFALYRAKKLKTLAEYQQNIEELGKIQSELQELCGEDADIPALIAKKNEEICDLQRKVSEYKKSQADKEKANLEDRLSHSIVVSQLSDLLNDNPVRQASREQIRQVTNLINEQIPAFYNALNSSVVLRPVEYEVCMLIRCHFKPSGVGKLLGLDEAYVSNVRRRILYKVYGIEGNPKDLDERIMAIG